METSGTWTCEPYSVEAASRIAETLGLSSTAASVLVRRGIADVGTARSFLAAADRSDPADLPGVREACEPILRHAAAGSRVAVFGDYDVDGVCSTAMMVCTLRELGADTVWRLPSREEGYGLSEEAVRALAAEGARLLVTVDCGVTSVSEVALARELGLEVVVTDHHRPGATLPACPIVHPGLGPEESSELCAAGVVLKLSQALRSEAGLGPAEKDLDLAGLATVCDMVPLRGENRRIAREGLAELARTPRPGLRALMEVAALEPADVSAHTAGFRLGPRINAAGRLHRADAALELMLTEDPDRAGEVARELDGLNHDRRETEQRILFAADAACAEQAHAGALVVAGEGWHPGVVGIVASRLVERHRRPCVVIGLHEGRGRGSGRSIAPYDLHEGLGSAAVHLTRFGGHRMAAGLEIEEGSISAFRRALATHAGERLSPQDLLPVRKVDAVVSGGALTLELAEELERLGPFGSANPAPCLLVPAAKVEHVTAMGEDRAHARFSLSSGGVRARGVAFRTSQSALAATGAEPHDVAVGLERNRWNGREEARVVMRSLSRTRAGEVRDVGAEDFWVDLERELDCDPSRWWPATPALSRPTPSRAISDRRGEGFAGVAGELLSSGEEVLLVVADLHRRRASLEANVASLAVDGLAVVTWAALGGQPRVAEHHPHLLLLDPPPVREILDLVGGACGPGAVHLAWGSAECAFALAYWRSQLDLRPPLVDAWRALSALEDPVGGEQLADLLRGQGPYPRDGALAGRLLRVAGDLGLAKFDRDSRTCAVVSGRRADLESSRVARAYANRCAAAEVYLAGADPVHAAPSRVARAS